jgi:hypothetical protein
MRGTRGLTTTESQMAMENIIIQMETCMKDPMSLANNMDKELSSTLQVKNMLANGLMVKNTARV